MDSLKGLINMTTARALVATIVLLCIAMTIAALKLPESTHPTTTITTHPPVCEDLDQDTPCLLIPNPTPSDIPMATVATTNSPIPNHWEEDSLPQAMYDWVKRYNADLKPWHTYDGHQGCWAAVADTTLIMCPDGFMTTS